MIIPLTTMILTLGLSGGAAEAWQRWGDLFSGFSGLLVLLLAIADSSILSVPEGSDLLIVILSSGKSWGNMAYYVSMTVAGSIVGCLILYAIGRKGGRALLRRRFSEKKIERAEKLYSRHGLAAVLISSVLPPPLPFKIFVLSAGVFGLSPSRFFSAIVIGRTIRYSMWGILAVLYGNPIKAFLMKNMKAVGIAICVAVVIGATAAAVIHLRKKPVPGTQ